MRPCKPFRPRVALDRIAIAVVVAAVVAVSLSTTGVATASENLNANARLLETFDGYPDGPLPTDGGSPWSILAPPAVGDATVIDGALQLPDGGVDTVVAGFAAADGMIWTGVSLAVVAGSPSGGEFAELLDEAGARLAGLCVMPGADPGTWSIGVTTPKGTAVDDASIMGTVSARVVIGYDSVTGLVSVAVEPGNENDFPATLPCQSAAGAQLGVQSPRRFAAIAFGAAAGTGDLSIDNLLVTDLFADAAVSQIAGNVAGATLTVTAVNPANAGVVPGGQYIEIMGIDVACTGANATFVSVTVDASGTGDDKNMVAAVRFGRDANGNDQLDAGEQTDSTRIDPDNGTITLSSGGRAMTSGTTERWLIAYDFESNAAGSFQLTMTSIAVDGGTATAGLPVASATLGTGGSSGGCGVLPGSSDGGASAPTLLLLVLAAAAILRRRD